ncbi:MAG: protoporphyrinogen IX oxidase [Flavobacteriales bacterium]|jgi:putative membrane protein|nr:protoporphyrinogen IX oxidase [Flavobacteriales bacterium]|tara:strand:- start:33240 stop:33791 length:552 start_codon:yes stop_codon:yes gene_type:complete
MTAEGIAYIKSLHIIFVVTWFAGLFYMVRLFVYFCEAQDKVEPEKSILSEQYKIMMKRLWYIIAWPSMVLTVIFGSALLTVQPDLFTEPWMHAKLVFVLLLIAYHHVCGSIFKKFKNDIVTTTSAKMRLWNEVATLLLFAIVFLVELQNEMNALIGVGGLIGVSLALMAGIKIYKNYRSRKGE